MEMKNQMQLKPSSILNVPIQNYDNDFSFVVNGKLFKTSKIVSDLLSPTICRLHSNDPTIDVFNINTAHQGDFSRILNLINFNKTEITDNDLPFFSEVFEILGTGSIEFSLINQTSEITIDNVFHLLQNHEKYYKFFSSQIAAEIEFISSHFNELCETKEEEFYKLDFDALFQIINSPKLLLKSEDQLLNFLNRMYSNNSMYSIFYETVFFSNVTIEAISEFITLFDVNDMNDSIWQRICERLKEKIECKNDIMIKGRYESEKVDENQGFILFKCSNEKKFEGIINYLNQKSNGLIKNLIGITSSSVYDSNDIHQPINIALFDDQKKRFRSMDSPGSWIRIDFKDHRIIPSDYAIRSTEWGVNCGHPANWVIECSKDGSSWTVVDEQRNCSYLNGKYQVHSFKISSQCDSEFRYIQVRSTGQSWAGTNTLAFDSFEVYGKLI